MTHTEYMRIWRERNRERVHEINRRWRERHPEQIKAARKASYTRDASMNMRRISEWRAAHPELVREYRRLATLRGRRGVEIGMTAREWLDLKAMYGACAYCGTADALEQDHVVPISAGGLHTRQNVVPSCRHCNATKGSGPAPAFTDAALATRQALFGMDYGR